MKVAHLMLSSIPLVFGQPMLRAAEHNHPLAPTLVEGTNHHPHFPKGPCADFSHKDRAICMAWCGLECDLNDEDTADSKCADIKTKTDQTLPDNCIAPLVESIVFYSDCDALMDKKDQRQVCVAYCHAGCGNGHGHVVGSNQHEMEFPPPHMRNPCPRLERLWKTTAGSEVSTPSCTEQALDAV